MNSNAEYLKVAKDIANKAGELLVERFPIGSNLTVQQRGNLMDSADRDVHDLIHDGLKLHFPTHILISVFTENQQFHVDRPFWVIDPIVGLGNFGHGDSGFALSIAYVDHGITQLAVVYNPILGQMFTAHRNRGSYLNGQKIWVSKTVELKHSLLSTRFPYDIKTAKETNLRAFNKLILKAESVRNNATATLDMAYVASGQYDGFWAIDMNPWDLIAATLLVEEAGGSVSGVCGEQYDIQSKDVLVTNGLIHDEVLDVLSQSKVNQEKR